MTETAETRKSGATISDCGRFRYSLWRRWGNGDRYGMPSKYANFIMLNHSGGK